MRFVDAAPPETPATRAALELITRYGSRALVDHSIRSWYWAAGFAETTGIAPADRELLAVAALLHDVGLMPAFDNVALPFETAGGHVGWAVTAGAGWATHRRDRVVAVIERHMWVEVDPADDPEGHLLEIATGLDISGARAGVLPDGFVREVLAAHPRGDLAAEFTACVTDQAARKPDSQAARIVAGGVAARLAAHPLG
ncbi:MAG: HD domain-containing protein [Amnibacterium sp.]